MRRPPTILEANAMASTAAAAGYSTGTALVSAMAALLLVTGEPLPLWQLMAWLLSVSALGLLVAVALRRALDVSEALAVPTGQGAAGPWRSLCAARSGAGAAGAGAQQARALLGALAVGAGLELSTGVAPILGERFGTPLWLALPDAVPTPAMQRALP